MLGLQHLLFSVLIFNSFQFSFALKPVCWNCNECNDKSLSFYTASAETWWILQTNTSVEVIPAPKTIGAVTGGEFGEDLFKFHKFSYNWEIVRDKIKFEIRNFFYNTKYETFENALNYPNGVIQIFIPVNVNAENENPMFKNFEKTFKKIKKAHEPVPIFSLDAYNWFKTFPTKATYTYFTSLYFDQKSGKIYPCVTTLQLLLEESLNFMSRKQFEETFGSLKNHFGKPLENTIPRKEMPTSNIKLSKGIKVHLI